MTITDAPAAAGTRTATRRLPAIDALRGAAIVAMAAYHTVWDLAFLGLLAVDLFSDPLWLAARTAILGSFLFLAGVSLALAAAHGFDRGRYLRRLGMLVAAAAVISALSYALFPDSPIFFGVLHHLAVGSVLGLAFLRLPPVLTLALGVAVFAAGELGGLPSFDQPWLRWVGLMTFEPSSNDYVPVVPWFGIMLAGIATGRLVPRAGALAGWRPAAWPGSALAWMGRHALAIYLIHQPVLFGSLWLLAQAVGGTPDGGAFMESCTLTCTRSGSPAAVCERTCGCVADGFRREGLWDQVLADRINPADQPRANAVVRRCL